MSANVITVCLLLKSHHDSQTFRWTFQDELADRITGQSMFRLRSVESDRTEVELPYRRRRVSCRVHACRSAHGISGAHARRNHLQSARRRDGELALVAG